MNKHVKAWMRWPAFSGGPFSNELQTYEAIKFGFKFHWSIILFCFRSNVSLKFVPKDTIVSWSDFDRVIDWLIIGDDPYFPWWRHQREPFSTLLTLCAGNSPVTDEFPSQRPVTRSFDVFFDLRLNKRLSKQSWGWWFETPPWSSWRHCNADPMLT